MLSGYWSYWSGARDQVKYGNLSKRVSLWHMHAFRPGMRDLATIHSPPKFARDVLSGKGVDWRVEGSASRLHLFLLLSASKQIIASVGADEEVGVGPLTCRGVQQWFHMMGITKRSELYANAQVTRSFDAEFQYILDEGRMATEYSEAGDAEHPYFNPEALFLRVAHLVYFYTKSEEQGRLPFTTNIEQMVEITQEKMEEWEYFSGELISEVLKVHPDKNGLHLTDRDLTEIPVIHFAQIKLPYRELKEKIDDKGIPCVQTLHEEVMQRSMSALHSASKGDGRPFTPAQRYEMDRLAFLMGHMQTYHQSIKPILQNREKVRRSYIKGRNQQSKPYKAKLNSLSFQRDIFVMGTSSSHFFNSMDSAGRNAASYHYW